MARWRDQKSRPLQRLGGRQPTATSRSHSSAYSATTLYQFYRSRRRRYLGPSVLVVDELGYLPLDQASANWIFQVVSRRYDKGSIILTSNRGFADWGQVFADSSTSQDRCFRPVAAAG